MIQRSNWKLIVGMMRRITILGSCLGFGLPSLLSGCGTPPRGGVSGPVADRRAVRAWWAVQDEGQANVVVIGLERRLKGGEVEQWLIAAQGARRLTFSEGKLLDFGAPLSANTDGFRHEAPLALHAWSGGSWWAGASAEPGTPAELATQLEAIAASDRCEPPRGMTLGACREAMFDFPRGLKELLALDAALK